MKNLVLLFSMLSISIVHSFGQLYVRYNQKGYSLAQKKELIILTNTNSTNEAWTFSKDNKVVLQGKLGNSLTGKGDFVPTSFSYAVDFSSITEAGIYTFTIKTETKQITIGDYLYRELVDEMLRTFRVRRSGSTEALEHGLSHTGDTSCHVYERNGINNKSWIKSTTIADVSMKGGWYDAGDYIKFTLTTAYSAYFLLKSYEASPELFTNKVYSKSNYTDILDEAKHGLDYLMKTYPNPNTFIIQVGGYQDHEIGERLPENDLLNGYREAYHSFSRTHMGYTAAALALGARQFATHDATLANQYKQQAIAIFTKAESSTAVDAAWFEGNGKTIASFPKKNGQIILPPPAPNTGNTGYATFYSDNNSNDNMALAALELYKLTNDAAYLTKAKAYATKAGAAYWNSWSNMNMTVHNALAKEHTQSLNALKTDLTTFNNIAKTTNNIWNTPHETTWGSLYSYIEVANSIAEYHISTNDEVYFPLFVNMVDYTLGKNNWGISFLASKTMPYTADNAYAQIYKVTNSFPTGELSEGPTTLQEMQDNGFTATTAPESVFNTKNGAFFNDKENYVTMETTICGQADGIYFFTLASKVLSTTPITNNIIEEKTAKITVFPNPSTDSFTVTLVENATGNISIQDITGKVLYANSFENAQKIFVNRDFPAGNYLVKVQTEEGTFVEKIVIQ